MNTLVKKVYWGVIRALKKKKKNLQPGPAHLGEVEEGRLAEQNVCQEHGSAGQHLDLVLTKIMAAQELAKVPGEHTGDYRTCQMRCDERQSNAEQQLC